MATRRIPRAPRIEELDSVDQIVAQALQTSSPATLPVYLGSLTGKYRLYDVVEDVSEFVSALNARRQTVDIIVRRFSEYEGHLNETAEAINLPGHNLSADDIKGVIDGIPQFDDLGITLKLAFPKSGKRGRRSIASAATRSAAEYRPIAEFPEVQANPSAYQTQGDQVQIKGDGTPARRRGRQAASTPHPALTALNEAESAAMDARNGQVSTTAEETFREAEAIMAEAEPTQEPKGRGRGKK